MKTTNNKHIIKEKLERVDLPDMDSAWTKMETQLDVVGNPIVHGISQFIGKYKMYLNIFIAALTIGAIGFYVKSKTYSQTASVQSNTNETIQGLTFEFAKIHTTDASIVHNAHEFLAEVPEEVVIDQTSEIDINRVTTRKSSKKNKETKLVNEVKEDIVVIDEG